MIENIGEIEFSEADEMNVPVNIFIGLNKDDFGRDDTPDDSWILRADNFMPRKCLATEGAYCVASDNKEELIELVKKYILPFYQVAIKNIEGIIGGQVDCQYYWE